MPFQNEGPTGEYAQVHKPSKEQQPKQMVTIYVAIYVHMYIYSYLRM